MARSDDSRYVILTDADGLANIEDDVLIVIDISRREVESGNIASALERLHVLTDSAENVRRYREALVFQIGGYDSDPRELPEIPKVRAFFHRLVEEWPHWLWFLHRGVGAIGLLLALLCDVRVVRGAGSYGTEFLNQAQLAAAVADLLDRGNALFATYGITAEEAAESADSAVVELLGEKA